jgi:predicted transcriptional regulator
MAVDQENVSKVLAVLSHRLRREILFILCEKGESSFTDLMNALNVDTGKLLPELQKTNFLSLKTHRQEQYSSL